jgi:radical SAM superfamily enzyme YgiQ (UPF0313 family)
MFSEKTNRKILLIGYEDQENLGLRSIKAFLDSKNIRSEIIQFNSGSELEVLKMVQIHIPLIIGFSLIFQYTLLEFGKLISFLRINGITSHFTSGGHFPSIEPKKTFNLIPELDSIIQFEGELTLFELALNINNKENWKGILGLVYRDGNEIIINQPRPLIDNLDEIPVVYRDKFNITPSGIKTASILASRGCLYNCSFCSIRQFYGKPSGSLRRSRSPILVADEIHNLFKEHDVRFFSFQDDDFANRSNHQKEWINIFLKELKNRKLSDNIRWKISCRVDDLDPETIFRMKDNGLIAVYLGVESGSNFGLKTLNKGVSVKQNLEAINLVKDHNIALSIGFMLFDPYSYMESLKESISFLRTIGSDGYFPINFCKMLPYAGTPIEKRLINEARLVGTDSHPDYEFLDPIVSWYYFIIYRLFTKRNFSSEGLVCKLQNIDFEMRFSNSFLDGNKKVEESELRKVIIKANLFALDTLEKLLNVLVEIGIDNILKEKNLLVELLANEMRSESLLEVELKKIENKYYKRKGDKKVPYLEIKSY